MEMLDDLGLEAVSIALEVRLLDRHPHQRRRPTVRRNQAQSER